MSMRRLLDQADLPAEQRALLQAGRAHAPVHYDIAHGALRLQRTLAEAAAAGTPAASPAALPGGLAVKFGVKGWLAIALAGVCTAGASVAVLRAMDAAPRLAPAVPPASARVTGAEPPAVRAAPARAEQAEREAPARAVQVEPTPNIESTPEGRPSRPAGRRLAHTRRTRAPAAVAERAGTERAPTSVRSAADPTSGLEPDSRARAERETAGREPEPNQPKPARAAEPDRAPAERPVAPAAAWLEARGIARARRVLERDPSRALLILAEVARAHPDGYLVEERRALEVLALAAAGRAAQARRAASAFLARHPDGPFTAQVKAAVERAASH